MAPSGTSRRQATPVTRDRAVQAAITIADAAGIESVSMRRLARELGVEAMSLYHHVKNKDDLIDGMVDAVFLEIVPPDDDATCSRAMHERVESSRTVLSRHPWAIPLMEARSSPGHATLKHHDTVVRCLRESGFSMPLVGHTMSLIDSYVRGFAMQDASPPDPGGIVGATRWMLRQPHPVAETFPHLAELAAAVVLQPGYESGKEFTFGLKLILDGIQNAHLAEARASHV